VNFDITEQREVEAELDALRETEKAKEKEKRTNLEAKLRASLTAAAAAHEINQPLARILLTSRLVMEHEAKTARGDSRISGFVQSLAGEAQSVVATIEKMKSLMRNTRTDKAPVDLCDLADSAVLYTGSFARPVKARVTFDRPARPAVVTADADQLQIALNNLLRNAIEAVAELPGRRRREIRIEVRHGKDRIELVVGDIGRGLPEGADQDHLPESTKPGGTGLGLLIVRTALENHGGDLQIGRSPLGGAEVRMVFPKAAEK
jgi:signal transduction histidine kinase